MAADKKAPGLERATKSLPLHGGMTEEIDGFVLEAPGMGLMRNVRFTKTDFCEKAEARTLVSASGVTNESSDYYGMFVNGNRVAIIGNDNVAHSDDAGATWDSTAQNTDLLGIEKVCSTIEASGAMNFQMEPCGVYLEATPDTYSIMGYACAWETITLNPAGGNCSKKVHLAFYTEGGHLVDEQTYDDHHSPKLQGAAVGIADCLMVDTGGDIWLNRCVPATEAYWGTPVEYARALLDYNQLYNPTDVGFGPAGTPLKGENMRMGYSNVTTNNQTGLCFHNGQPRADGYDDYGVIAYKEGTTIRAERTLLGVPQGGSVAIATDATTFFNQILAVYTDGIYNWFLVNKVNTTTVFNGSTLHLYRHLVSFAALTSYQHPVTYDGPYVNGTIHLSNGGTKIFSAATYAHGDPTDKMQSTLGEHAVQWSDWSSAPGSVTISDDTYSHRLVSNMVVDKDNLPHVVVQQWDNWNPDEGAIGGSPAIPSGTPTMSKPVTSVQLRWQWAERDVRWGPRADVVATYDAGQSKAMPESMGEQNTGLQSLVYWDDGSGGVGAGHNFWYGNANILTAEDHYFFVSNGVDPAWPINDSILPLASGISRMNVYHLNSALRVPYELFAAGMVSGTSVPVWYDDAGNVMEITCIDSPEIVGATGDGSGISYNTYQEMGLSGELSKYCQAVTGYYDSQGIVHRSAPSSPLFLGNTDSSISDVTTVTAYVTPPLSVSRDRSYFIEIYEAFPGETAQLCYTTPIGSQQAQATIPVSWKTTLNPTTGAWPVDVTGNRGSKALYTNGDVLAADPWPAFDLLAKSGRRLFAHSISDPSALYYSKTFENGISPEFNAALVISIGNEKITAIAAIDDKVLVWTAREMWLVYGTGPDNTGANGDFFVEKFPHAIGCTEPDSILSYEEGIAFLSNTGEFKLITRDLQMQDFGDAVKGITGAANFDVVRALVYAEQHELLWYVTADASTKYLPVGGETGVDQPPRPQMATEHDTAFTLVYNYKYKKWSMVNDPTFNIAAVLNGKPCGLVAANFYRTGDDWVAALETEQETPWFKTNNLQDFGRVYGATFLGRYFSSWTDNGAGVESGDIEITVLYDYEGAGADSDVFRFRANKDFGAASGDRLQVRVRPSRQKCQAIRFLIKEVSTTAVEVHEPTYAIGRGFSLTSVDLHYGIKGGSGTKNLGADRKKG
jgi:hypothetical protein